MLVPFIIPVRTYPYLVKKSELDLILNKEEKGIKNALVVMAVGSIVLQLLMLLIVLPRLSELYTTAGQSTSSYTIPIFIVSIIIGIILIIYFLDAKTLDATKVEKVKSSKDEVISIHGPLINNKLMVLALAYLLISVLITFGMIILPIYSLSSSV